MDAATALLAALFLSIVQQEAPELLDRRNEPKGIAMKHLETTYDFIIVGAGAAGSVVASRLSEVTDWKILLIESGGDEDVISKTPLFMKIYRNRSLTWEYSTVFQENACQATMGICDYPTGKLMGGSSSINGMLYARGSKHDYDEWERMGCTGWSYDDVLPYFKKSENARIPAFLNSKYHGKKGPLVVQHTEYSPKITSLLLEAAQEIGIPRRDYNGEYLTGVDIPQVTIDGVQRCSASSAYLVPLKERANLHILKHSTVRKVIINSTSKTAVGVEFESEGIVREISASKEVILSSGAINSPKLLMLSGVGPKEDLEKFGVEVISDVPVGKNFQDHAQAYFSFTLKGKLTGGGKRYSQHDSIVSYAKYKKGFYSYNAFPTMLFFSLGNEIAKDPPDVQIHINDYHKDTVNHSIIKMMINKAKPESTGTITLKSTDPREPPLIDPKYFTAQRDLEDTVKGLKIAMKLMNTTTLSKYKPTINYHHHCFNTDDEETFLKCIVRYYSGTVFHPVGTVSMGARNHPDSVVDPALRVIGVNKLRVIDASVMPRIIRANTNAPTMMIAEKASDMIKQFYNKLNSI